MGEHKVVNKYYSPDFDPSKIGRPRKPKNQSEKVRMMLPFPCRCSNCYNYMYPGTKFNTRKEEVRGEMYLDRVNVFRFYFRCTRCSCAITYKTDPQNCDHALELGATRCFEATAVSVEEKKRKRKRGPELEHKEEMTKTLEKRASASKREMDVISAIDELKSLKSRQALVTVDAMIHALPRYCAMQEDNDRFHLEEEEELIKSIAFYGSQRRIHNGYNESDDDNVVAKRGKESCQPTNCLTKRSVFGDKLNPSLCRVLVVRKPNKDVGCSVLQSLCQNYDSDNAVY